MKQIYYYLSSGLAGFTFMITFILALMNGVTLLTTLMRSTLSALMMLILSLVVFFIIEYQVISRTDSKRISDKYNNSQEENNENFQPGYQHIMGDTSGSQIDKDIAKLIEQDPARASELINKMGS